jgi:hypothetical protein
VSAPSSIGLAVLLSGSERKCRRRSVASGPFKLFVIRCLTRIVRVCSNEQAASPQRNRRRIRVLEVSFSFTSSPGSVSSRDGTERRQRDTREPSETEATVAWRWPARCRYRNKRYVECPVNAICVSLACENYKDKL